jgi:signal peptidase I
MPIELFKIKDRSMQPTINDGDYVLVTGLVYLIRKPKVNDIIVLRHPQRRIWIIKRISKIVHGKYYVEGDNKEVSQDSRKFGLIGKELIIGKVIFIARSSSLPVF